MLSQSCPGHGRRNGPALVGGTAQGATPDQHSWMKLKSIFTGLGMFFFFFGSVHFYWGSAKNKVFCHHTKSRYAMLFPRNPFAVLHHTMRLHHRLPFSLGFAHCALCKVAGSNPGSMTKRVLRERLKGEQSATRMKVGRLF